MVVKLQLIEYCKWGNKKEGMDTGFGIDAIEKIKQEQYIMEIFMTMIEELAEMHRLLLM